MNEFDSLGREMIANPDNRAWFVFWLDRYCDAEAAMARSGQNREPVYGKGVAEVLAGATS